MPYYCLFLISSEECRLQYPQVKTKIKDIFKDKCKICCIEVERSNQQLYVKENRERVKWNDMNGDESTIITESEDDVESRPQRTVCDLLHELADSMPFAGCIIDIFVDVPEEFDSSCEGFLPLYGAVRRFKDWHNTAVISIYQGDNISTDHEFTDIIPGIQTCRMDDLDFPDKVIWRGKISVVDKTVNKGFILPGLELRQSSMYKERSVITHPRSQEKEDVVLGRMLEVLDEVDLESIPPYMLTSNVFYLTQRYQHPHAMVFMEHIRTSQSGILMRLLCYHGDVLETLCGEKYLNTTSWKESIIADITFIQEPEEELLLGHEYIHFKAYCKEDSQDIIMCQLRSPYELNGQVFDFIYHNSLLPSDELGVDDNLDFISELPFFSEENWNLMMISLKDIQVQLLKEWLNDKENSDSPTIVKLDDLHAFLYEVQKTFLNQVKENLPVTGIPRRPLPELQACSELEKSPSSWSERCLLVYQESQRKSFNRLQSTDSMALSSPVQSEDMPSTIDITGFLKLFQQDGNPAATKLSPVRKRHPSRSFRLQNSTDMQKASWPDCHYMPHFDIYYNIGKKTEKLETQNYKLREKHVKAETLTSGPTTVFKLPKKKSNDSMIGIEQVPADLLPRKSPRKSFVSKVTPPRKCAKGALFSPRKSAGRGLLSPRKPLKKSVLLSPRRGVSKAKHMLSPTRRSPRKNVKGDLNTSLPSTSFAKPSTAIDKLKLSEAERSKRRHSVGDAHIVKKGKENCGRKSLSSANDSLNMSASLDDSITSQKLKESRSERHKRRLQEIVHSVLKQQGVDKDSSIYQACATKLFKVTKLFVMDLPTSQNLKEEMKNIAEGQVQQVINLESRRQSIGAAKN
ncbi:mdm2-binding protein-like [Mytilus californianus]|uniref:mdm2-binding protein-like n=1 Tax=Mytilus californianus TaxID=6549 RepID=UPI0022477AEB|nr:mdm2-binding protein-like [Mytilus californianus]